MPAGTRAAAAGNFMFELDGMKCGFVRSVEGGTVKAEVVREARGRGGFVRKQLGTTSVEPFALELGLGLDKSVYAWMTAACAGKAMERSGAIVLADQNFVAKQRREFERALITEVGFPAADASAKDVAFLTLRFSAQAVRARKASGTVKGPATKAKTWQRANFRLEIAGLDCKRVSKIDAFTIPTALPVDFPDLHVTLLESSAQTWVDWHQSFVIDGKNDATQEKTGLIALLAPNMKDVLGEVRLFGLGIYRLAPAAREGAGETVRRLRASLYCERIELDLK